MPAFVGKDSSKNPVMDFKIFISCRQTSKFSVQTFWSQIFILPNKVLSMLKAICRSYLWTGGCEISKKAMLAWDKVCWPKTVGGFNVIDIFQWNKAAICKHYWNLCRKKDRLWIQWVHTYYIKDRPITEANSKQTTWIIWKILKSRETV